jgi:hypothetical protein
MLYDEATSTRKSSTFSSIKIESREYWTRQGVPWREILDLHLSIVDRLRSSSWWSL